MKTTGISIHLRAPLAQFELDCELEFDAHSVGLFGPSGAGKTTVLELVAGWRRPASGFVRIGARTLYDSARGIEVAARERGVGYVPQDLLLFSHWTVLQNITAAGRGARGGGAKELAKVLDVLELSELASRSVATLSGGERQRVALARALSSSPDLLLLDEPLGALDEALRRRILPYLLRVRESFDVPLLLVSHDPTEVQALCDQVAVLERGRVTEHGEPAAILGRVALGGTRFENVLRGEVRALGAATAEVELAGGVRVRIPLRGARPGFFALFGLRADDVLVAIEQPRGLSARNVLPARVDELERQDADVIVNAHLIGPHGPGPSVRASLTTEAVTELSLAVGRDVHLVFKTQSCHLLA